MKCNLFIALKILNPIVQRFRSKGFSSACLFRLQILDPFPQYDTVSDGGWQGWGCAKIDSPHLNPLPQGGRRFVKGYFQRLFSIFLIFTFILLPISIAASSSERPGENRVLAVVQKMESVFKIVEDYSCDVEQIFYKDGTEDQRFRFKFYFKKKKKIRVDFSQPYLDLSLFYNDQDEKVTVMPFRFLSVLKLRYSIDNPRVQTPAGQRLNQTDMGYFIEFLFKNLQKVQQKEDEFQEDKDQIKFSLLAMDYIEGKLLERYRISMSKQNWLPVRIERYNLEGKPMEVTIIQNYSINSHLEDKFFLMY